MSEERERLLDEAYQRGREDANLVEDVGEAGAETYPDDAELRTEYIDGWLDQMNEDAGDDDDDECYEDWDWWEDRDEGETAEG